MRRANWISLGIMVTRFAWMAHKLVSSNNPTKYASLASCNAKIAVDWKRRSVKNSLAISLTRRWKGNFLIIRSVDFWYFLISRSATVPGRYRCGFFTPPVAGALFLAAFVASLWWNSRLVFLYGYMFNKTYNGDHFPMASLYLLHTGCFPTSAFSGRLFGSCHNCCRILYYNVFCKLISLSIDVSLFCNCIYIYIYTEYVFE